MNDNATSNPATPCPAWCDDHELDHGFDFHRSTIVEAAGYEALGVSAHGVRRERLAEKLEAAEAQQAEVPVPVDGVIGLLEEWSSLPVARRAQLLRSLIRCGGTCWQASREGACGAGVGRVVGEA
jgi:hypothetical protein